MGPKNPTKEFRVWHKICVRNESKHAMWLLDDLGRIVWFLRWENGELGVSQNNEMKMNQINNQVVAVDFQSKIV